MAKKPSLHSTDRKSGDAHSILMRHARKPSAAPAAVVAVEDAAEVVEAAVATAGNFVLTKRPSMNCWAVLCHVNWRHAPVAQLDRAVASGATGREFESLRAHQTKSFPPRATS